jgi:hypothetical protein
MVSGRALVDELIRDAERLVDDCEPSSSSSALIFSGGRTITMFQRVIR